MKVDVGDDREHERHADDGGAGDVQERDDARQVHEQDHEEHRREDRQEPLAVLLAEQVVGDVDAHHVETHLDEALEPAGHDAHAARAEPEDEQQGDDRDEADEHDAVDLEGGALEEQRSREEFVDRRPVEVTIVG